LKIILIVFEKAIKERAVIYLDRKIYFQLYLTQNNSVNWAELGSVCDGRHLFSQKSLENSLLPDFFEEDIYREPV